VQAKTGRAAGWPLSEIQPTVAAYLTMLRAELAGQPYVKAHFNREIQAATGRSRRAVEDKFMNISAALRDIGLPYIPGHKPYPNLQGALRTEVERFLARDPEIPRLLKDMPHRTCPQRSSSPRSIRQSWLRQPPAAAAR
jgi:hypothetical protein